MRRERLKCPFCGSENEMFVVDYIFSCSKCGNLWSITELETVYECTGYNCGMLFSKSESDFPANQCPYCAWRHMAESMQNMFVQNATLRNMKLMFVMKEKLYSAQIVTNGSLPNEEFVELV